MRDADLYGRILGLQALWFVEHVDLDVAWKTEGLAWIFTRLTVRPSQG